MISSISAAGAELPVLLLYTASFDSAKFAEFTSFKNYKKRLIKEPLNAKEVSYEKSYPIGFDRTIFRFSRLLK